MNPTIFTKLLLFIYCLLLITGIQGNFVFTVLAQNTVFLESKNNSSKLSRQEELDLKQGKVVLKGQKGIYLGQVIAKGNIDTAWEVLTDYNNFDRFLPDIAASKIIKQHGDRVIFEQVNVVDLWLFQQEFKVQIEAIKSKPSKIDFKLVDGDLKKLIGRWHLIETSPGKISVSHAVQVEPGADTEKPFFYGVYESSLEETLKAIAIEIDKRSQS